MNIAQYKSVAFSLRGTTNTDIHTYYNDKKDSERGKI